MLKSNGIAAAKYRQK